VRAAPRREAHRAVAIRLALLAATVVSPAPAEAKIVPPLGLNQLVRDADVVLIGRVKAVVPSLLSPWGMIAMGAVWGAVLFGVYRRRAKARPVISQSILLLVFVTLASVFLGIGPGCRTHRRIALVEVERCAAGAPPALRWVPVWFSSYFACDTTDLRVGSRYALFLEDNGVGYRMSWYGFSAWDETPDGFRGKHVSPPLPEEPFVHDVGKFAR
jgi:hypothetical protein